VKNIVLSILCFLFAATQIFAQTGSITGQVTDAKTGETLFGANVVIAGTTTGAAADFDGNYTIANLEAGTYDLQISSVSYASKTIKGIVLKAGEIKIQNITLGTDEKVLDAIVVETTALKNVETAMLAAQRKAGVVQDGLSSEQMSRNGDSNIAAAIKRVTGVSVEGGKYVYVRGLGDRYSKTTLNGAEIPGLDPNRNSVQMDLFPSNLVDNLVISKTFSPDMPASFSGGYVNIVTKDFPDNFTLQINTSLGYNSNASLNKNFLTYDGGKTDWLGIDDGTRELPESVENGVSNPFTSATANENLDKETKAFNKTMGTSTKSPFLNQKYAISIGNKTQFLGRDLGFIAGLTYQKNYSSIENGETGRYSLSGNTQTVNSLNPKYILDTQVGTENVLWGAVLNTAYKLSDNSKISLNLMHNQSGKKEASFRAGVFDEDGQISQNNIYQTRSLQFLQRGLSSAQLKGEHTILESVIKDLKVDWISSYTLSSQKDPDLRFFTNDYLQVGEERIYRIQSNAYSNPSRYFRDMKEFNWDNKVNLSLPFTFKETKGTLKFGGVAIVKNRDFNENRYDYVENNINADFEGSGNVDDYFSDNNLGVTNGDFDRPVFGTVIRDNTQLSNSYTGKELIGAAYVMTDWNLSDKWRAIFGVRYERTDIFVESDNPSKPEGKLQKNDFLPALNLTYKLTEKMNLRGAYGRTLARPTFRELAPYATFDFVGDFTLLGNEKLRRTLIDNIDLRWEMYPSTGELISVSAFYKNFHDPIEKAIIPQAVNLEQQYRNVDQALVYGVELEIRKKLDFISLGLRNFSLGANVTIVKSQVDINAGELARIRATDPDRKATRQMFGQSPYIFNSYLNYENPESGWNANVSYNVFGKRLAAVSAGGLPNVFEQSRPSLNLAVSKSLNERLKATFRAKNLLNPAYKLTHEFKGEEYVYSSYTVGQSFSFSLKYLID
jgi:TonB-dependent receptor